jgi:RNA 2',3'-cyclic 3'-phosphodiesterase
VVRQEPTSLLLPGFIRHISLGRLLLESEGQIRSFIAVEIERPDIVAKLEDIQSEIRATEADLRAVDRENLHITMRFLGDIPLSIAEGVVEMMKQIKFEPFVASLHGIGVFPKMSFPRVIWVGVLKGSEILVDIHRQLEIGLGQLGFQAEHEPFNPHITLFRVRSGRHREALVETLLRHQGTEFGEFDVRAIQLKRSILTPTGPIYSTIGEARR